jgi:hypothetical protein
MAKFVKFTANIDGTEERVNYFPTTDKTTDEKPMLRVAIEDGVLIGFGSSGIRNDLATLTLYPHQISKLLGIDESSTIDSVATKLDEVIKNNTNLPIKLIRVVDVFVQNRSGDNVSSYSVKDGFQVCENKLVVDSFNPIMKADLEEFNEAINEDFEKFGKVWYNKQLTANGKPMTSNTKDKAKIKSICEKQKLNFEPFELELERIEAETMNILTPLDKEG